MSDTKASLMGRRRGKSQAIATATLRADERGHIAVRTLLVRRSGSEVVELAACRCDASMGVVACWGRTNESVTLTCPECMTLLDWALEHSAETTP